MRVAVVGPGATGGFFGALLARAEHQVHMIGRGGPHLDAIRQSGLCLKSKLHGTFTVSVHTTEKSEDVGPVDLVLFSVKTYDLDSALRHLPALMGPSTAVLLTQNGVDSPALVSAVVGQERVLPSVAYMVASVEAPGVVVQAAGSGKLVFGDAPGSTRPCAEGILQVLKDARIAAEVRPDVELAVWEKFVFICAYSGVLALTRLPIGHVVASASCMDLFARTAQEVWNVAHAEGKRLAPDVVDKSIQHARRVEPWGRSSMSMDLMAGRRLELDALNGAVSRRGYAQGVATPVNDVITAALLPFVAGRPTHIEPQGGAPLNRSGTFDIVNT